MDWVGVDGYNDVVWLGSAKACDDAGVVNQAGVEIRRECFRISPAVLEEDDFRVFAEERFVF